MADQLTDAELAGLNLLIELKKSGQMQAGFIGDIANGIVNVAKGVAAVTAAAAAVQNIIGASVAAGANVAPAGAAAKGATLGELLEARELALDARK